MTDYNTLKELNPKKGQKVFCRYDDKTYIIGWPDDFKDHRKYRYAKKYDGLVAFAIDGSGYQPVYASTCADWCFVDETQDDQWDEKTRGKKMSDTVGRTIYKYQMPVLESFTMKLPQGAKIIRVADEGGMFWLWAEVRTDVPDEERKFMAFKTGGKMPDDVELEYIGFCAIFVQMELGLYIYEVIE